MGVDFLAQIFRMMPQNFLVSVVWLQLQMCSIQDFLADSWMEFLIWRLRSGILGSVGSASLMSSLVSVSCFTSGVRPPMKSLRKPCGMCFIEALLRILLKIIVILAAESPMTTSEKRLSVSHCQVSQSANLKISAGLLDAARRDIFCEGYGDGELVGV